MRKFLLIACRVGFYIIFSAAPLYALGDGTTPHVDMPFGSGIANFESETQGNSFIVSFGYENILKRQIDNTDTAVSGELEGGWALLGLGYRIANQFEPYLRIGVSMIDAKWSENYNDKIELDGSTDLAVGLGLKMLVYQRRITSLSKLKLGLDGQVRYTNPSVDSVKVDGASRSVSASDLKIFEGRVSATVGVEISLKRLLEFDEELEGDLDYYLIPYIGAVYSDGLVTADYVDNGTRFGYSDDPYEYKLNMLAGMDLIIPEYLSLNVEGQLFNDKSLSGGLSLKF